jgi:hypothetical protein
MALRLFLVAFLTGVCTVLFALVLVSVFSNSSRETAGAASQAEQPGSLVADASQLAATQAPDPTPAPSLSENPEVTPEPSEEPQVVPSPTPVPTSSPGLPASPPPPGGLRASFVDGEGVVLTWDPVAGAGFYNIYRSELPGGGDGATYLAIGSSGSVSGRDTSVRPGVAYYYVVTSSAGGLESDSSNEAAITIPGGG